MTDQAPKSLDPNELCKVCRIKKAMFIYFDIPVCSGCRAFFIRSMKSNKSYYCMNSRLCGQKNELVPTRRVCKKCRFDRCIEAGMLEAKVKLHNHLKSLKNAKELMSKSQTTLPSKQIISVAQAEDSKDVLALYVRFRQSYMHEIQQVYKSIEFHECNEGPDEMMVVQTASSIFRQAITQSTNDEVSLFHGFDEYDLLTFKITEYSQLAIGIEAAILTAHNFGHKLKRAHLFDNSYKRLNIDTIKETWSYLFPAIQKNMGENAQHVFNTLMDHFFQFNFKIGSNLASSMEKFKLDEHEIAALHLLIMTREAYVQIAKSQRTQMHMKWLRNQTFKSLAKHIESTGHKNVNERMFEIVSLIEECYEFTHLIRKFINLLTVATNKWPYPEENTLNYEIYINTHVKFDYF